MCLVGVNSLVISALPNFQKSKMAASARPATRRKIGFKSLVSAITPSLTRVKGAAKFNLFAYFFDLGKCEVKYVRILTSPLTRVKNKLKGVVAVPHFYIVSKVTANM